MSYIQLLHSFYFVDAYISRSFLTNVDDFFFRYLQAYSVVDWCILYPLEWKIEDTIYVYYRCCIFAIYTHSWLIYGVSIMRRLSSKTWEVGELELSIHSFIFDIIVRNGFINYDLVLGWEICIVFPFLLLLHNIQ